MIPNGIDQVLCAGDFHAQKELTEMTDFETMFSGKPGYFRLSLLAYPQISKV